MRNSGPEEVQAGIKTAGEISITSDMQTIPRLWQKTSLSKVILKLRSGG